MNLILGAIALSAMALASPFVAVVLITLINRNHEKTMREMDLQELETKERLGKDLPWEIDPENPQEVKAFRAAQKEMAKTIVENKQS